MAGLYGRCELTQFVWIQEPSATDRKINNFGKGGVDKQRLVETDWKDQESAHPAPPTPTAAKKHPHHQSITALCAPFSIEKAFQGSSALTERANSPLIPAPSKASAKEDF